MRDMNGTFEVQPGECFGCLALKGLTRHGLTFQVRPWRELLTALNDQPQDFDDYWLSKEPAFAVETDTNQRLDSSLVEKLSSSEVFLTVKRSAPQSYNLLQDGREERLKVTYFQAGLAVWLGIPEFNEAVLLIGMRDKNRTHLLPVALRPGFQGSVSQLWSNSAGLEQDVRQRLDGVVSRTVESRQWSLAERIGLAAEFARRLKQIIDSHEGDYENGRKPPRYWRVNSGVVAFLEACRSPLHHVRIHQYVRAVESFLPPKAWGETKFANTIGILCESGVIESLKEIYRLRNKTEHHEYFEDAELSGSVPEETAWLRVWQAEVLCLELYRRFFTQSGDFLSAYSDSSSIENVWAENAAASEWGAPLHLPSHLDPRVGSE